MAIESKRQLADLPKAYDPQSVEERLYRFWEEQGYFHPQIDPDKKPFVISMPPPNVTGALHLGHAITATLEDIMIRYHRMKGDPTLWVPGEDHAGIATQAVVEKQLAKEGADRHQLGREKFVERVWEWVRQYKHRIQNQHRRLGASCDWTRERFTLDEGLSKAVREVFVRLYEEGLAYRGERIINWCPRCMSSISDLEVEVEDTPGKLYYVRYPIEPIEGESEQQYVTVATTRPETILGDTAVAVNPRDPRYQHLIGRVAILPVLNRPIPIIGDDAIELEFGTGAMKVTPAHDPTDFEIGNRHDLPRIQVIGFDAKMTEEAGPYAGQDRYECREHLLADLEQLGLLAKTEEYTVPLGHCQRCGTVIEPLISKQWFVKMAPLATPALNAVKYGLMKIVPERFNKTYIDWLENIRDWNISRQLWWGHRIPAWFCDNGHLTVSREDPAACATCGSAQLEQDPDVLDTWFSSWLWPFSTLGWPDDTADLRYFYPTSVMETGYDIIFFWVARMAMSGIHFLGTVPFQAIYLHGLVRDEQGRKMSKSLGNVIDPIEVMDQYGTDALRFTLATSSTPGNDMKLVPERIIGNRNFANKIWNAARFVITQTDGIGGGIPPMHPDIPCTLEDCWILSRLQELTASVTRLIDEFQFGEAGRQIYDFFWSDYCDWYLEIAKVQLQRNDDTRENTAAILRAVLDQSMRLLHPFMPYVTEEVWQHLYAGEERRPAPALIVAPWPAADEDLRDPAAEAQVSRLQDIITRIRDARKQMGVEAARRIPVLISAHEHAATLRAQAPLLEFLARTETPRIEADLPAPEQAMSIIASGVEVYLPLAGMVDIGQELGRIDEEIAGTEQDIGRSQKMLANEQFVSRARPEVVQRERDKLAGHQEKLAKLQARRKELE